MRLSIELTFDKTLLSSNAAASTGLPAVALASDGLSVTGRVRAIDQVQPVFVVRMQGAASASQTLPLRSVRAPARSAPARLARLQVAPAQIRPLQIGALQTGAMQNAALQVSSFEVGAIQACPGQVCPGE